MPHIPGHPADDPMIINEDEGLGFLFPDVDDDAPPSGLVPPGEVGDNFFPLSSDSNATQFQSELFDLLRGELSDPDKPLGSNFKIYYWLR